MNNRIVILLIFIGILAAAVVFTRAQANSAIPTFVEPPAKQTVLAEETKMYGTAEARPTVPEPAFSESIPLAPSCPRRTPNVTGVIPLDQPGPFGDGRKLISRANAISNGLIYWIWAGAPDDNPDQGMIRVITFRVDPCASNRLGTPAPKGLTDYLTPRGPLTLTKMEGDILFYDIASGGSGRFNFVEGKFLP